MSSVISHKSTLSNQKTVSCMWMMSSATLGLAVSGACADIIT